MRLFHATKSSNYNSIKRVGLTTNRIASGYGKKPEHNAVYLYFINNVDVTCDMITIFDSVDVWEVMNIDEKLLIPDEDSGAKTWIDSIEKMGTCAYRGDIPVSKLKYIGRFDSEDSYIAWAKMERLMKKV